MRNERHTCRGRGVLSVRGGNDEGIESEGHCQGANGTNEDGTVDGKQEQDTDCGKGDDRQSDEGKDVDAFIAEDAAQIHGCNGHTREEHCNGGHAAAAGIDDVKGPAGQLDTDEPDEHTEDHTDEHGIDKAFQSAAEGWIFFAVGDEQDGHAPHIDQNPERDDEDEVFEEDFRIERFDDGIAHKAEVREGKTVGKDLLLIGIFGQQAREEDGEGQDEEHDGEIEEDKRACGTQDVDGKLADEGTEDEGGHEEPAFEL